MKTVISTPNAPGAIGPYSQGYAFGDLVITSGQIPVDPATGAIPEGIAAQAEQSCKNVGAILEAAGVTLESVVKTTCFLADMGDFAAFNEVYAKYFTSKPARSCGAVRELPKGVLCDRGHRRQVNLISSKESRSPEGPALLFDARAREAGRRACRPQRARSHAFRRKITPRVPGPQ